MTLRVTGEGQARAPARCFATTACKDAPEKTHRVAEELAGWASGSGMAKRVQIQTHAAAIRTAG